MLAALGSELCVVSKREESVLMGDGFQENVSPFAPGAAVGASSGDVRLAAEAHASAPAITALNENLDAIDEHADRPGRFLGQPAAGRTLTLRPLAPWFSKR